MTGVVLSVLVFLALPLQSAVAYAPQSVTQTAMAATYSSPSAFNRIKQSWSWYVSRASGMLAAVLLALLVLSGVGLLTGQTYRFLEPLPAWAAHRALGIAFVAMSLLHILVLLFDKYIGFSLADLLIPFAADYKPLQLGGIELGSMYVALGILALYAVVIIMITTHFWMDSKPHRWKAFHYTSYGVLAAVFVHGLFLGTDLKSGPARIGWLVMAAILVIAIGMRLYRARTIGKDA